MDKKDIQIKTSISPYSQLFNFLKALYFILQEERVKSVAWDLLMSLQRIYPHGKGR